MEEASIEQARCGEREGRRSVIARDVLTVIDCAVLEARVRRAIVLHRTLPRCISHGADLPDPFRERRE
jgi:hypothetical protein